MHPLSKEPHASEAIPSTPAEFWDALAPHHSTLENNYLDVASIRRIMNQLCQPVLVVGAGQGLIVAEVRKNGLQCEGVDLSPEMIQHAKLRRGISLIKADAKALPFAERTYGTVIYATGVIDFTEDEQQISVMLKEGKRILQDSGKIFIAFYRLSAASESFLKSVGLLTNHVVALRESFELYLLNPVQMIAWVARKAGLSYFRAACLFFRMSVLTTMQEKLLTLRMQKIFRRMSDPNSLMSAVPERQFYRNEAEIRNLFKRLSVPIKQLKAFASCYIVQIQ